SARNASKRIAIRGDRKGLALPRCPSRKREAQQDWRRYFRLRHNHGTWLKQRRPQSCDTRQETVFAAFGFGRIESADDLQCRVCDYSPFDLTCRLLRSEQGYAERPAAFGNVEQYIADRTRTFAGRIFVQFIKYHEHQRSRCSASLLLLHHPLKQHADDEHL